MTKQTEIETLGDEAYKKGDFLKAIEKYDLQLKFAQSKLHAAELAHKIAMSYRGMCNYDKYLLYEEKASNLYPSSCSDHAADFLKTGGDFLDIIGENELSRQAYKRASFFFAEASEIEEDIDSAISMNAWSIVCKAKIMDLNSSEIWIEASEFFFEAARKSEGFLSDWRNSKAYQCKAMSRIFKESSVYNLREANEMFKKALDFDETDIRLGINLLANQIVLALAEIKEGLCGIQNNKSIILQQLHELIGKIRSIGPYSERIVSNLDSIANKIKDIDSIDNENFDALWHQSLRIIHIFAL